MTAASMLDFGWARTHCGAIILRALPVALCMCLAGCATGSTVLIGKPRPPLDPDSVRIYSQPPGQYELVGLIEVSVDARWTEQGSLEASKTEIRKQAAKIGANGVILRNRGMTTSTLTVMPLRGRYEALSSDVYTIGVEAIFINL